LARPRVPLLARLMPRIAVSERDDHWYWVGPVSTPTPGLLRADKTMAHIRYRPTTTGPKAYANRVKLNYRPHPVSYHGTLHAPAKALYLAHHGLPTDLGIKLHHLCDFTIPLSDIYPDLDPPPPGTQACRCLNPAHMAHSLLAAPPLPESDPPPSWPLLDLMSEWLTDPRNATAPLSLFRALYFDHGEHDPEELKACLSNLLVQDCLTPRWRVLLSSPSTT
jgi:hypothetical protein